jgi:hypothetical protein
MYFKLRRVMNLITDEQKVQHMRNQILTECQKDRLIMNLQNLNAKRDQFAYV